MQSDSHSIQAEAPVSWTEATPPAQPLNPVSRIEALDFAKGVLVVFMVAYHSLNYSPYGVLGIRWMGFLPPSFILITGFLLIAVYRAKYSWNDARMHRRLMGRGLKILGLFTCLNLILNLAMTQDRHGRAYGPAYFFDQWWSIYVRGQGGPAAFDVLVPIAYVLIAAPAFILIEAASWKALAGVAAAFIAGCAALEWHGHLWPNLGLMAAGVVGMVLGRAPISTIDRGRNWWPLVLAVYVFSVIGQNRLDPAFLFQMLGAAAALLVIYWFGVACGAGGTGQRAVILLGNYSLAAYIGQIAILHILSGPVLRAVSGPGGVVLLGTLTLVLTLALTRFISGLRSVHWVFDRTYRTVFA